MTESTSADTRSAGTSADAFMLLARAVNELTEDGLRPPTASEVRLELKRITHGGFDPKIIGFRRFRDFLAAAAVEGHIGIDSSRPGDLAILPSSGSADRPVSTSIRSDIWRAFVDWDERMMRFYDKVVGRAQMIPKEPVPFEPEKYHELRRRVAESPQDFIQIEPVDMRTQLRWMQEYVDKMVPGELRALLRDALASEKPLKLFVDVLRNSAPRELALWHREFAARIRREAEAWRQSAAANEEIDIERHQPPNSGGGATHTRLPDERANSVIRLLKARHDLDDASTGTTFSSLEDGQGIRTRLHHAIDRMPIEELKLLRIPVGYLFED